MDETFSWLLEEDNPAVRYYTLKDILGKKGAEIKQAYEKIVQEKPVSSILSLQDGQGWWTTDNISFNPLYRNTFWQLYFLSQAGLGRRPGSIDRAVRMVVENMQDRDGSFYSASRYRGILPCMQGIAAETLIRLGYGFEDCSAKALDFIHKWISINNFRCKYRQGLNCPWGAAKILKALNCMPPELVDEKALQDKKAAISFLLKYSIAKASYPRKKNKSSHWVKFGFPRSYQSDILEVTMSLVDAGLNKNNRNIHQALDYIYSKMMADGKWKMEFSLNGRMLVDIEKKGKPSKWVTFMALKTLIKSGYL
ncbi:MAG: hypothetical protein ACQEP5_06790 [Actinomycetota bacterium]